MSETRNNLISVALCTYNGEKFVAAQLESIFNQDSFVNEIVICDDESSDSTVSIIKDFIKKYPNRIRFIQNSFNIGTIRSFEKCIQACSGDIIFLSDQDDIWYSDKVGKFVNVLINDNKALAVFSDGELIDANGNSLNSSLWVKWKFTLELQKQWENPDFVFSELLFNRNIITGATLAFRRKLMPFIIPFELPLGSWHDSWIGLVASGLNGLRYIKENTIYYRIHEHQQVGLNSGPVDKKSNSISHDLFLDRVFKLFPDKKAIIYPESAYLSKVEKFAKRILNKLCVRT